jgi:hypothetical protein
MLHEASSLYQKMHHTFLYVYESADVRLHRAHERLDVVAALEHANDRQVAAPKPRHLSCQPLKIVLVERERRHVVVRVRIKTRAEED